MPATQQDPTQAAFDQSAQVPDVPASGKEKAFGLLKGLTVGSGTKQEPSALEQAIEKQHAQRLNEARMHKRTAAQALGIWTYGKDPKTGEKLTPEEEQQYLDEWNKSMEAFGKVAGVDKKTKAAIQQNKQIAEAMAKQQRQKYQGQQGPSQYAFNVGEGGVTPNAPPPVPQSSSAASGPGGGGPPQVPLAGEPPLKDQLPFLAAQAVEQHNLQGELQARKATAQQDIDFRREQADKLVKQGVWTEKSPEYSEYVFQIKHPAGSGKPPTPKLYKDSDGDPFMGLPNAEGKIVDVDSGEVMEGAISAGVSEFAEHQWTYADAQGNPHPALRIGKNMVDAFTKEPLPAGTEVFSAWVAPRTTTTHTPKFVTQPDGSTKFIGYVDTTTVRRPGAPGAPTSAPLPSSSGTPAPAKSAAAPKAPAQRKPSGGAGFSNPKPGDVVGGKTPPGVAKAYEQYRGSVTRQRVMEDALPLAIGGDQQAMINLLYNHIGMTTGLQKGARMSQELISDAEKSRGMVSGLASKLNYTKDPQTGEMIFNWDDPIREGTTLTVPQMKQMVNLAADRSKQEKQAWLDEVGAAKKGYGMSGDVPDVPPTPSPTPSKTMPSSAAPKTADEFFKKKGIQ